VSQFYKFWETFSFLYRPSTVNPVCRDEADYSCDPCADHYPPG